MPSAGQGQPFPPTQQRTYTSGLTLNLLIAQAHQITTQLIGVQLSIANLLAIGVSALSVVAGTITVTAQKFPSAWPLYIAATLIGIGLAILIEGMTLGALIRIRLANTHIRAIEERLEQERGEIGFWEWSKHLAAARKKRRATRLHRRSRIYSLPLVVVGSVSSAVAGGLFYHTILADLGAWESFVVAALFPFVVTCTFVSSELFKGIQEEAIKEGFTGGGLSEAALKEETRRLLFQAAHDDLITDLQDEEVQRELRKKRLIVLMQTVDALLNVHVPNVREPQHLLPERAEHSGGDQGRASSRLIHPSAESDQREHTAASSVQTVVNTAKNTEVSTPADTELFTPANREANTSLSSAAHSEMTAPVSMQGSPELTPQPRITKHLSAHERSQHYEQAGVPPEQSPGKKNGRCQKTSVASINDGDAAKRIQRILRRHPTITVTDLAQKAKVSRGYASQIRAQVFAEKASLKKEEQST